MTREEIYTEVQKMLFEDSGELSREDFRELLEDVISDCKISLNALDEEEE